MKILISLFVIYFLMSSLSYSDHHAQNEQENHEMKHEHHGEHENHEEHEDKKEHDNHEEHDH